MRPVYLRLTEDRNAYDYLEHACDAIMLIDSCKIAWKWVVIGLHGALYSYMICALEGSNYERVTRMTKHGLDLISFDEALKRCQSDRRMRMYVHSSKLLLRQEQKESIRKIKDVLRNSFVHYKPKIWYIELNKLPDNCIDVLEVIRFLALDSGNVRYQKRVTKTKTEHIIKKSINALKKNRLYLEVHRKDN